MGSSHDSRYWTCPSCCTQFDWDDDSAPSKHHPEACRRARADDAKWQAELQRGKELLRDAVKNAKDNQ